jgi:hypothetical protein
MEASDRAIIAKCEKCGKICAAVSMRDDSPELNEDRNLSVLSWLKDGLEIETVPAAQVREGEWCSCNGVRGDTAIGV